MPQRKPPPDPAFMVNTSPRYFAAWLTHWLADAPLPAVPFGRGELRLWPAVDLDDGRGLVLPIPPLLRQDGSVRVVLGGTEVGPTEDGGYEARARFETEDGACEAREVPNVIRFKLLPLASERLEVVATECLPEAAPWLRMLLAAVAERWPESRQAAQPSLDTEQPAREASADVELPPTPTGRGVLSDWSTDKLRTMYRELWQEHGERPTQADMAGVLGADVRTFQRHMERLGLTWPLG